MPMLLLVALGARSSSPLDEVVLGDGDILGVCGASLWAAAAFCRTSSRGTSPAGGLGGRSGGRSGGLRGRAPFVSAPGVLERNRL